MKVALRWLLSMALFLICAGVLAQQIQKHHESLLLLADEALGIWPHYTISLLFFLIAMFIRSHRWALCLARKDLVWLSFRSIAIGYLVQCPLSKLGEVVRMTHQKKHSDLTIGEIVSTVFIDRLLDVFALLVLLLLSLQIGEGIIMDTFPSFAKLLPKLSLIVFLGLGGGIVFVLIHRTIQMWIARQTWIPPKFSSLFNAFVEQLTQGILHCRGAKMGAYLVSSTIFIWLLYFFSFHLAIAHFPSLPGLVYGEILILFIISAIGVLVPTPGGLAQPLFLQQGILMLRPDAGAAVALSIGLFCYFINFWLVNILCGGASWTVQLLKDSKTSP